MTVNQIVESVLEFLLIVRWPALALAALLVFRGTIKRLVSRITRLRTPVGVELDAQAEREEEATSTDARTLRADARVFYEEMIRNMVDRLSAASATVEAIRGEAGKQIQSLVVQSAIWELRYLSLFLVPHTQELLRILNLGGRPFAPEEIRVLSSHMGIPYPEEHEAVVRALQQHELLVLSAEGAYSVSQKGRAFLSFVGKGAARDEDA